jgi:hypothetical protein
MLTLRIVVHELDAVDLSLCLDAGRADPLLRLVGDELAKFSRRHRLPAAGAGNRSGFKLAPPGGRDPEAARAQARLGNGIGAFAF